jgi:DNA-binding LytR/AlgR family response regulator
VNVLLIEDEILAKRRLVSILHQIEPSIQIIKECEGIQDCLDFLNTYPSIDLIISDIQVSDGNIFELFKIIKVTIPIIFTTAYDQYAIQAFKQNSIDYLLKPIEPIELKLAIEKFKKTEITDLSGAMERVGQLIQEKTYKCRFLVNRGIKWLSIPVEEIAWIQTFKGETMISNFKKCLTRMKLVSPCLLSSSATLHSDAPH